MMKPVTLLALIVLAFGIMGCSGVKTFPNRVAPGETVAIGAGWKHKFSRDNLVVTVTPQGGPAIPVSPERVRASINLYPDPLSSLALSDETGANISPSSATYSLLVNANFTGGDEDWWQTTVFVDLPTSVPTGGLADIAVSTLDGTESVTTTVRVVEPDPSFGGTADIFDAQLAGPLDSTHLQSLERVDHYVVSFDGATVPYAVQLDLAYQNMTGYVVNPRGLSKSLSWSDNAGTYRVLMLPASQQQGFAAMSDLKFYVAAMAGTLGLADLSVVPGSVLAFDQNGAPVPGGVSVDVALVPGAAGLN
jgi:hypothetical protein